MNWGFFLKVVVAAVAGFFCWYWGYCEGREEGRKDGGSAFCPHCGWKSLVKIKRVGETTTYSPEGGRAAGPRPAPFIAEYIYGDELQPWQKAPPDTECGKSVVEEE